MEKMFEMMKGTTLIFVILGFVIFAIFVIAMLSIFNSKFRNKKMGDPMEVSKNMMGGDPMEVSMHMMDNHMDDIKSISTDMAEATEEGVEITARAIKRGLTEEEKQFCKNCGEKVDKDAKFCTKCGKKL